MTGPSLLQAAVDELYSHPMAEFVARRAALVAAARKAGDRPAATLIAGLRKPTLSADTLNRLVRAAPAEIDELLTLGADLRAAEKALDGTVLRELSAKRRQLVNDLTQLAFEVTDQRSPSASVRDEVTATLNAALADEDVADRLTSGALVTHARWDGFGSASLPELAAVLPSAPRPTSADQPDTRTPAARKPDQAGPVKKRADRAKVKDDRKAMAEKKAAAETERKAEAKRAAATSKAARERTERIDAARQDAAEADARAKAAAQALTDIDRRISELSIQLAHQRQLLAQAQQDARTAQTRRRASLLALTRAGGTLPD